MTSLTAASGLRSSSFMAMIRLIMLNINYSFRAFSLKDRCFRTSEMVGKSKVCVYLGRLCSTYETIICLFVKLSLSRSKSS